jgi:hypothetical protein
LAACRATSPNWIVVCQGVTSWQGSKAGLKSGEFFDMEQEAGPFIHDSEVRIAENERVGFLTLTAA